MCEVCGHILEDVLHTIRDNTAARNIWNLLTPFNWHNIFYSDNLYGNNFAAVGGIVRNRNRKWILGFNVLLGSCSVLEVGLWGILDGLGILVDWGYDHVLIQTDSLEGISWSNDDSVKVSYSWAYHFALSGKALTCSTQILTHCTHLVGNWACLNTDGSVRYGNDFAAIGGTVRNRNGKWILGFNVLLGSCSVLEVGLWGILDGLGILVDWGYDHVLIQTDSLEVAKVIQKRLTEGSNSSLIRKIL
ncbi:hypothetical protein Gotur_006685 [Gossypium turneri]